MNTEQNENKKQLTVRKNHQMSITVPLAELQTMAQAVAKSGMFGVTNESQALALMLLCQAEGLHPVMALRRYHIVDGKPSMRADAMQGDFEQIGTIMWHDRTDQECAATFFLAKKITEKDIERAKERYRLIQEGKSTANVATPNEITIVRTIKDAIDKKVAMSWKKAADGQKGGEWVMKFNWKQSPRQMLHARCLTEGVRALAPGIVAGVYTEDEIYDQRGTEDSNGTQSEATTAEERVKTATANATDAEIVEETKSAPQPEKIVEVTEFNWRDIESHVGKAKGPILGKKISELPPSIISWFLRKWQATLKEPVSAKDAMLLKAVEFAAKQPKTALWMRFVDKGDAWGREDFFEAMKVNGVLGADETNFDAITEEHATRFLANWEKAEKLVNGYLESKKQGSKQPAKG